MADFPDLGDPTITGPHGLPGVLFRRCPARGDTSGIANNFYDSGDLDNTQLSTQVTGLPTNGTQVFVRLQYQLNGVNHHIDYQFGSSNQGPPTPSMSSPAPGSTLPSGDVSFAWNGNGAAVDEWHLLVGTSAGDNSLYDGGVLPVTTTSAVASGQPEDGSTIHVTL